MTDFIVFISAIIIGLCWTLFFMWLDDLGHHLGSFLLLCLVLVTMVFCAIWGHHTFVDKPQNQEQHP